MDLSARIGGARPSAPEEMAKTMAGIAVVLPFEIADVAWLSHEQRRTFLEGCLKAQEFERIRIGRELHDSTGQLLVALRLGIAQLRDMGSQLDYDDYLGELDSTAEAIESQIRAFSFLHYPAELRNDGLSAAMLGFIRGFGRRTGLRFSFSDRSYLESCNGPAALALLRICQEALTNVYRHARASKVSVGICERGDDVELTVRDDGCGIAAETAVSLAGVGLQGMRHRAELQHGRLTVRRLKCGTRVRASIPLSQFDDCPAP